MSNNIIQLQIIQSCFNHLNSLNNMSPIEIKNRRILQLDAQISDSNFWNNPKLAANVMKERKILSDYTDFILQTKEYLNLYDELFKENGEISDKDMAHLLSLNSHLDSLVFTEMMKDPIDQTPAIISINAGAGGLEAANWVSMLLRMYVRFANIENFKVEILDEKPSEEHSSICTDSVSIRIEGPYAYGFLKSESGVHRLIRNSPFNAADARQTSFAAVYVSPDIEDSIDIKIEDKDIEITAQTAGGPGGQNQNRIKSAIRLKHIPTGINILVRTERDQLSNKKTAFKMLKAKLYQLEVNKKKDIENKTLSDLSKISFGSQIRTYMENPHPLVKDHRSGYEILDFQYVLDGQIKDIILSVLIKK